MGPFLAACLIKTPSDKPLGFKWAGGLILSSGY